MVVAVEEVEATEGGRVVELAVLLRGSSDWGGVVGLAVLVRGPGDWGEGGGGAAWWRR